LQKKFFYVPSYSGTLGWLVIGRFQNASEMNRPTAAGKLFGLILLLSCFEKRRDKRRYKNFFSYH